MTEQPEVHGWDEPADAVPETERVRTGVDSVDAVLAAVEELADRPVEEHVAVFEGAHEQLRRALDNPPPAH